MTIYCSVGQDKGNPISMCLSCLGHSVAIYYGLPWAVLPHHSGLRSSGGTRKAQPQLQQRLQLHLWWPNQQVCSSARSQALLLAAASPGRAGCASVLQLNFLIFPVGLLLFLELLVQCLGPEHQEHHLQMWGSLNEPRGAGSLLCTCEIIFCSGIYPQHDPVWKSVHGHQV